MSKVLQNAPREHSAILSSIIKLPFVFKAFVLSILKWPLKTGFTVVLNVLSSLAIHFTGEERVGCFVSMCSCCRVTVCVLCLFLTVPWVGLRSVTEAFPGHTHLLFNRIHVIFTFHIQW